MSGDRADRFPPTPPQIVRGEAARRGTDGSYYRLASVEGVPRSRRLDLAPDSVPGSGRRRSLLHFAHLADIHTADVQSPGRFEFMQRFHPGPEPMHLVLPACRPQEALTVHAVEATIRTVNRIGDSSETGVPLQLVLCTGDNIDNQQLNELRMFMALAWGGPVTPGSGGQSYEGVQALAWNDPNYWQPDRPPAAGQLDCYKTRWGFPEYPGLLEEAVRPFRAQGIRVPWLSCYGNHDALVLGAAIAGPAYERIVSGPWKTAHAPPEFDPVEHLPAFISHPERFLTGPSRPITPDRARRTISRREFVGAHLEARGEPAGHGFIRENLERGTAYYVYDAFPQVRIVILDTTNPGGHYQGSVGAFQMAWLEERLAEVHSRYYTAGDTTVQTGNDDCLVVVCSHHNLPSLALPPEYLTAGEGEDADLPRSLGPDVESLLHRFPNVILWINGHIHRNRVRPRPRPRGRSAGFWEVTTSSLIDWPCQARRIEIVSNCDGTLSLFCTMVDHDTPLDPRSAWDMERLASLHRELAANDPHAGYHGSFRGGPGDRTVELVLPAPFDLA